MPIIHYPLSIIHYPLFIPQAEAHRKNLHPHTVNLLVNRCTSAQPAPLHHCQPARETDSESRKDYVEGNRERELNPHPN